MHQPWEDLLQALNESSLKEITYLRGYPSLEVRMGAFIARHPDHPMAELARSIVAGTASWLGMPPATDAQIMTTEQRLGIELPSDYKAFLKVANGFFIPGDTINSLLPVDLLRPFGEDNADQAHEWRTICEESDPDPGDDLWVRLADTIQLSGPHHHEPEYILLDTKLHNNHGELTVVDLSHQLPEHAESFRSLIELALYASQYGISLHTKGS